MTKKKRHIKKLVINEPKTNINGDNIKKKTGIFLLSSFIQEFLIG